jgi:hypothetical protein
MSNADPKFRTIPSPTVGQNWCVEVIWPDGQKELLSGFDDQYATMEWIQTKSANWVVDKIMQRPG